MMKISIDSMAENNGVEQIIPPEVGSRIFNAVTMAFARLGEAKRYIEVVKVTPNTMTDLVQFIEIKMVISYTEPHSREKVRIERDFAMFIHDNLEEFLSQRIIVNFQEALAEKAASFRKIDEAFRATIGLLHISEFESGNDKRCRICGTIREPLHDDERLVCPRCTPTINSEAPSATMITDVPTCPNCGHVGVERDGYYKCLNCGESLGKPGEILTQVPASNQNKCPECDNLLTRIGAFEKCNRCGFSTVPS